MLSFKICRVGDAPKYSSFYKVKHLYLFLRSHVIVLLSRYITLLQLLDLMVHLIFGTRIVNSGSRCFDFHLLLY